MDAAKAALVVAAYEFEDPRFQRLRAPARDVDALAGVLGDPEIGGFSVKTVVNKSGPVVQQELERFFSDRKPEDLLLLYFSCHGVKDSTGRLYFATTNTAFDLLRSTGVPAAFVSEQMELTRSKRIVLLLDCCYSGAFVKGFRERGDNSVPLGQLEGRGRAVITASRATEYAFEADELTSENSQPSVFTGAIVEGLSTGAADRDGDGRVTVDELYDYVYDNVRGKVAGQTPGRWVNLEGDLVIARNPRPPVRPTPLSAELARAIESDVALHRLGAVLQLSDWIDHGDAGQQLTARDVLERLTHDYDGRVSTAATARLAAATPPPASSPTAEHTATTRIPEPAVAQSPAAPAPAAQATAPETERPAADTSSEQPAGGTTTTPEAEPAGVVAPPAEAAAAGPERPGADLESLEPANDAVAEPVGAERTAAEQAVQDFAMGESRAAAEESEVRARAAMADAAAERAAVAGPGVRGVVGSVAGAGRVSAVGGRAGAGEPWTRLVGWLAAGGLVSVVLGVFLPFIDFGDDTEALAENTWMQFWLLFIVVLVGYAVLVLLGDSGTPTTGIGIVMGITPTLVPLGLWIVGVILETDAEGPGVGLVFFLLGCLALSTGGVVAAVRTWPATEIAPRWSRGPVIVTGVATILGVVAAAAWAEVTIRHYEHGSVSITNGQMWGFIQRLLVLTVAGVVLWGWLGRRISGAVRLAGIGVLYSAVVVLFIAGVDFEGDDAAPVFVIIYGLLAVTAMVVPVVATIIRPASHAAVVLAAWAVASIAAWLDTAFEGDYRGAGAVLNGAFLAAIALALVIAARSREGPAQAT